jgi:putative aldouronate transport system permease protein
MRKFLITFGLITMYFNGGLIPTFLLIRNIGLYNNFLVYLLPTAFSMFNTMIFIAYFKGIPDDIEECASIDGANDLTIFFRIIIPIAMPVIACLALYVAVFQWNQYFDCMIYTDDPNLEVLSYLFAKLLLLQRYIDTVIETFDNMTPDQIVALKGPVTSITTQMATMVVTTAPILCIYPFLQKYFVKGIMVGSLKE